MGRKIINAVTGEVTIEPDWQPDHVEPPPTVDDLRRAVDWHVEQTARARQYNNAASCASYVTSSVSAWAAEATAFVAWRDAVWVFVFQKFAEVQAGTTPYPETTDVLVNALPAMVWPS